MTTIAAIPTTDKYYAPHNYISETIGEIVLPTATFQNMVVRNEATSVISYGTARFELTECLDTMTNRMKFMLRVFRNGKQKFYFRFASNCEGRGSRDCWMSIYLDGYDQEIIGRAEQSALLAARKAEMCSAITVGTIFVHMWGYEQTNVHYYEVVAKSGYSCMIRRIGSDTRETGRSMSGYSVPIPGSFTGEPIKKVVGAYGISMKYGSARITSATERHFCSWYA